VQVFNNLILDNVWSDMSDFRTHFFHGDVNIQSNGMWIGWPNQTVVFKGLANQNFFYQNPGVGSFSNILIDKTPSKDQNKILGEINQGANTETNRVSGPTVTLLSDMTSDLGATVSIDEGILDLNGFALETTGDIAVLDGGILKLTQSSEVRVSNTRILSVGNGGALISDGVTANTTKITHNLSGYYDLNIYSGGYISANHTLFEFLGPMGVYVDDGAMVDPLNTFNYCEFRDGDPGSGSTLLMINNNEDLNIIRASFPVAGAPGTHNATKSLNHGHVAFENASGPFSGETYENDPFSRIDWLTVQPILSVTPPNQNVSDLAGSTSFNVSNTGTGTMHWTSHVHLDDTYWLVPSSSGTGTNSGSISLTFPQNTWEARTGRLIVEAPEGLGSPVMVEVNQEEATHDIIIPTGTAVTGSTTCLDALWTITVPETGGNFLVESSASLTLVAGISVLIQDGFHAESGSYFHAYIDGSGCPLSDFDILTSTEPIIEDKNANFFNIYPNPTTGSFTVEFQPGGCEEVLYLEIYNLLGMNVLRKEVINQDKLNINMQQHSDGVYVVKAVCGEKIYIKKLLKQ